MKFKSIAATGIILVIIYAGLIIWHNISLLLNTQAETKPTADISVKFVSSTITADGVVTAQSQARLNFQTGGKLVYLPFKEGDTVSVGQTIARLDSYLLQRQLSAALNNFRSARYTFDQTQQNFQDNVLRNQQTSTYTRATGDTNNAIDDAIKRILDQNQATLDNSVINVELANYALQLSTLTSPIDGIITHQDISVAGTNITPTTAFVVADPDTMVFRANVPAENIYYVTEGSAVTLAVDGIAEKIQGTVLKIYPSKVTLASGQSVYQVDIHSEDLKNAARLDMSGRAIISTNAENVALAPAWTVLGGKYIWVDVNGKPELHEVKTGKIHGKEIEITSGLNVHDRIIIDPAFILSNKYQML